METQNEKSNGMMYVAGINKYNQLYFESNCRNCFGANIISPPVSINLKTSDCLSFSTFSSHSVTIMNNEPSATIGPYTGNKRVLFNKKRLRKWTRIIIEEQNQIYKPISAICGLEYTLYLLNLPTSPDDAPRLAYYHEGKNNDAPIILNTSNYVPIALYGGYHLSAAITEEGAILIIDSSIFLVDDHCPRYLTLPQNEKAIQIAFLNKFVYALSSTGQVYKCNVLKQNMFERVKCLKEYEIIQISGTKNHILVVSKDGQVLSHGQNRHGQLGVGQDIVSSTKFEVIESLKDYKIISAYAGTKHSLFQTSNGAIFACGSNLNGQLLLPDVLPNDQIIYEPIPTIIKKGATFCIAGAGLSCIFVNCKPPPMTPNMISYQIINQPKAQPQPQKQQPQKPQPQKPQKPLINSNKLKEILELQSQIRELKNNAEAKNNRIIQLRAENMTIIENIDKILLKIDQHEKQNPPKNNTKPPAVTLNKSRPLLFRREDLPIRQKKLEKEKEEEEEEPNQPNNNNEEEEEIKQQNTDESQNEGEKVQQTNNDHIDDEDDEDSDVDENEEDEENKDNEYEVNKNPVNNDNDTNQNDNYNNTNNDNEKLENNNTGFDNNEKDDSDDDFDENENVEDESNENKNSDHHDENDDNLNDADNKENEPYNKEDEEANDKYEDEANKKVEDDEENHNKDEDEETHNNEDIEETHNNEDNEETHNNEDIEETHNNEDIEETHNKEDIEETHNKEDNEEMYNKEEDKAVNDDEKINEEVNNKIEEEGYENYSSDEDNF